jgi:hypothetical protein
MASLQSGRAQAGRTDAEVRDGVERALARTGANGSSVARIRRREFAGSTSYAVEVVTVEFATGDTVDIFLKDFGHSKLPKDAVADRRNRERFVYANLLDGEGLGTAEFYGARWDAAAGRFWLMLEYVEGELLRDCSFEHWLEAAAWLGRLHGRFVARREPLQECALLERHDADFFVQAAERALQAVSRLSKRLAGRLAAVLEAYEATLAVLTRDSETLVHGSYRPQNVLVVRSSAPARICPADWELAAFGRSTYDLAFICDGFRPPRLDALLDAYEGEAVSHGVPARDRDELRHEIDCFRLHKTVNSLGHVGQWPHPAVTAPKVLATAEQLASALV